jgi:hypothetical protein
LLSGVFFFCGCYYGLKKTLSLSLLDKQIRNEDTEEVGGEGTEDMCTEGTPSGPPPPKTEPGCF